MRRNARRIVAVDGSVYNLVDCDCGSKAFGTSWIVRCDRCGSEYNGSGSDAVNGEA
jgi:hypothetical protein